MKLARIIGTYFLKSEKTKRKVFKENIYEEGKDQNPPTWEGN